MNYKIMQLNLKKKQIRAANTLDIKKAMYVPRVRGKPKLILSESGSSIVSEANSFLHEIDYNKDIDERIRDEIEERFARSPVNASYRFPRVEDKLPKLSQSPSRRSYVTNSKFLDTTYHKPPASVPKPYDSYISSTNRFQYTLSKSPTNNLSQSNTENLKFITQGRRIQTPVQGHINRKTSKVRHSRSGSDLEKLLETTPFKTLKLDRTVKFRPRSRALKRNESPVFKLSSKTPSPSRLKLLLKSKLV